MRSQGNIPSVMGYRNYFLDRGNPIRAKVRVQASRNQETGSTPMSSRYAGTSKKYQYPFVDDDSLIDWDQSSAEQQRLKQIYQNNTIDIKKNKNKILDLARSKKEILEM